MITKEASDQYREALKKGLTYYNGAVSRGEYPYLVSLDETVNTTALNTQYLGIMDIPTDLIKGTRTRGRQEAFAGNYMPLLEPESEFGVKWISLCAAHFAEGIRDAVKVYEYMGRFYVQEGNKRVSVLKSLGSPSLQASVTRILPAWSNSHKYQVYQEFLKFFDLSRLYTVQFRHRGLYAKLQASLGFAPDHVWTEEERMGFSSRFSLFTGVFREKMKNEFYDITPSDALICWLQVYPYESLKTMSFKELEKSLNNVWPEIVYLAKHQTEDINTEPENIDRGFFTRLFSAAMTTLDAAFIHASNSSGSNWIKGHELGEEYLEKTLGDRVTVKTYFADAETADEVMETAIRAGAKALFVTAPTLIAATRRIKSLHHDVFVFVCALSLPMPGVRAYYCRMYESKFIAGALAGAMTKEDTIGFVAKYPIFGVPAEINAFALGARLTHPGIRIALRWSCTEKDPSGKLLARGVHVISNHDVAADESLSVDATWGTYLIDGKEIRPIAGPCWNWGIFYERVCRYILNGEWDTEYDDDKAVNYWWGMNSGIIDILLSEKLPDGQKKLAQILKDGIIHETVDIFRTRMVDSVGKVRNEGDRILTPEEIMKMDWLLDNVDGEIPAFDDLLPMAQTLVRILGVYRNQIPPEKEEFLV